MARVRAIMDFHANPRILEEYKIAARKTAEQFYSRKNTKLFVNALRVQVIVGEHND